MSNGSGLAENQARKGICFSLVVESMSGTGLPKIVAKSKLHERDSTVTIASGDTNPGSLQRGHWNPRRPKSDPPSVSSNYN